jgi:hypothetical protein
MKKVMTLAVPGTIVCMVKRRCRAVVVKKDNIIIRLIELEFLKQYFANAINALQMGKTKTSIIYVRWTVGLNTYVQRLIIRVSSLK